MKGIVSIIIPIYNAEKYLERCIESVLSQSYKNIELILVDDGSTDNSAKICEKYVKNSEKVKFFHKTNSGVSATRNLGIEKSKGEFLFFLDADDTIDKNVISNLVRNYDDNYITSCRIKVIKSYRKTVSSRKNEYEIEEVIPAIMTDEMQGFVAGYLFKKEKCAGIKFDERTGYCEDILYLVDYIDKDHPEKIKFLPVEDGFYNYFQNKTSVTRRKTKIVEKLGYIENAMLILDEKTNHEYENDIESKKIQIFEYELSRADKSQLIVAMEKFKLGEYTGKTKRLSTFAKYFRMKNITKLAAYYKYYFVVNKMYGLKKRIMKNGK